MVTQQFSKYFLLSHCNFSNITSVFQNTLFKIQEKALIHVLDVGNTLQILYAAHSTDQELASTFLNNLRACQK